MDKRLPDTLIGIFRGARLALHLLYGMLLAIFYPHLDQENQRRILKTWSRQLLSILNIGIQIEGRQPARGTEGCLMVANHVSWLDVLVLNAIHPSRFIAKPEVRNCPVIGWLCQRIGTLFIERDMRQDAATINRRVSLLLKQGACIGLFPEGTTTDGKQVEHFHSAFIQPAIDAGVRLSPIALRYLNAEGGLSFTAAFTSDMTLAHSVWKILRCPHLNALVVYTPALPASNENRRVLARAAQEAIASGLRNMGTTRQTVSRQEATSFPQSRLSSQSAYGLLINPVLKQLSK